MVVITALCLQWKQSVLERVKISLNDCLSLTFIQPVDILLINIYNSKTNVLNLIHRIQLIPYSMKPPPTEVLHIQALRQIDPPMRMTSQNK